MTRPWKLRPLNETTIQPLVQSLGISPLLARLLVLRDIKSAEDADIFLHPERQTLHDPFLFQEMETAVERIIQAAKKNQKVLVHGDYDADGITSTCIMVETLRELGIDTGYYLPDRLSEGYGLQTETVESAAKEYQLIITVDCGTTSVEPVTRANELGLDVIITDHHDPGTERPPALALINPVSPNESYPNTFLSGAGVAWKLAQAIRKRAGMPDDEYEQIELAALGIVADVMILTGENRTIITRALQHIPKVNRPGFTALMESARVSPETITAQDFSFRLGPRINASSRMDHPKHGLELLLSKDQESAKELANLLNRLNTKRQALVKDLFEVVCEKIETQQLNQRSDKVLFVTGESWQRGIVGILAQKVMERYQKPAFILSLEADGIAHGSARAFGNADLMPLLDHARQHSISCGGHKQAAGMRVESHQLNKFESALYEAAQNHWDKIAPEPLWMDAQVPLEQIDKDVLTELQRMEPFGKGNVEPVFFARASMNSYGARIVGNNHLRVPLQHKRGVINAIGFGQGNKLESLQGNQVEIAYQPRFNVYQGKQEIQLHLLDIHSCQAAPVTIQQEKPATPEPSPKTPKPPTPEKFEYNRESLLAVYFMLQQMLEQMGHLPCKGLYLLIQAKQQKGIEQSFYQSITEEQLNQTVKIFTEIDLLSIDSDKIIMNTVTKKKQLQDSPAFQRLQSQQEAAS